MTLYKRGQFWHFNFTYKGRRFQGTTGQADRDDAQLVEDQAKRRARREWHGLIAAHPEDAPTIQEFANVFMSEQEKRLTRPDILERNLRMVLAFFGKRPRTNAIDGGPYHNLRLSDPITDPRWLDQFEQWMDARGLAGSTRNSYISAMSGIYKLAAKARYRARTGIERNPFTDVGRHPTRARHVTATRDDVLRWIQHGAPHFMLAAVIGALAWKLRVNQILKLRFDQHIDADLTRITFDSHKTIRHTGKPQVTVISQELRRVLDAVRKARPRATYVVTWRGKPIASLKTAAKQAATRAGIPYGMKDGAVTFHALRHVSATELARMGVSAALASKASGHLDPRTTEKFYVNMVESDEQRVVDQLGDRLDLADEAIRSVVSSVASRPEKPVRVRGKRPTAKSRKARGKSTVIH